MPRKSYSEMVGEMENIGGYCTDPVGKCLREQSAVKGVPKRDIDLCLRDSETYAAFQRREKLSQHYSPDRAERAWLKWTENFSHRLPSPKLEIWVDRKGGVFRESTTDRFGCVADVESCLSHDGLGGLSTTPVGRRKRYHELDNPSDAEEDLKTCLGSYQDAPETERQAIIAARRGQGRFRTDLIELWSGKCAVTKSRALSLLRASHIKPWRDSTNAQRLDRYNGLLLIPNFDSAFDIGLITFDDDGRMLLSPELRDEEARLLGIKRGLKLVCVFEENKPFLAIHRQLHGFCAK